MAKKDPGNNNDVDPLGIFELENRDYLRIFKQRIPAPGQPH